MTIPLAVPPALREALHTWDSRGRPPQVRMQWSVRSWQGALPELSDLFMSLPTTVGRDEVMQVCRTAPDSPRAAVEAFVAAMVWGYGRVGYGPFRTARVLMENPHAGDVLQQVAGVSVRDGGPAAFRALRDRRLKWLGVAFASKYLFFCASNGAAEPAPVLDRLVRGWLSTHAGWAPRLDWHVGDYERYVETVSDWAEELAVSAADVELLMFSSAVAGDPTSQWRQLDVATTTPAGTDEPPADERAVLEALDDAGETFAGLPGVLHEDLEDFERHLRELRCIVMARRRS